MLGEVEVVQVWGLRARELGRVVGEVDREGEKGGDVVVGVNKYRSRIIKDLGVGLGDR
jgi:hypothetical protein